jgi:Na+/H+-dicarboxylate symporter
MLNQPYFKYPLFYGILAGIATFLLLLVMQFGFHINPLGGKKEVGIIFVIIAMVLSVSQYRKANNGGLEFGKAFGICFFTTIISGFISLLLLWIFLNIISPNSLSEYINFTVNELIENKIQIIKNGISETDYADALNNMKKTSVKSILEDDFIKKIFLAIVPSFMISLYFKRKFID